MLDKIVNIKAYWDDDNGNICFKIIIILENIK
jgi:hypothetical protein